MRERGLGEWILLLLTYFYRILFLQTRNKIMLASFLTTRWRRRSSVYVSDKYHSRYCRARFCILRNFLQICRLHKTSIWTFGEIYIVVCCVSTTNRFNALNFLESNLARDKNFDRKSIFFLHSFTLDNILRFPFFSHHFSHHLYRVF